MGFITTCAPNRVLNCIFLLYLLIFLRFLEQNKKQQIFNLAVSRLLFLAIFILPIPLISFIFYKPYPSIFEFTLFLLIIFYIFYISVLKLKSRKIVLFFENCILILIDI